MLTAGEESGLRDWQFRGKRIAAAVMEDLFEQHGLPNATHVLLTGDSAGGVGAMNHADWIGTMLKYAHYILTELEISFTSCLPPLAA